MKKIDNKTLIVLAVCVGTIVFGLFAAYDVWSAYKQEQEPADTSYYGKLREYEKQKLILQGRIDSLKTSIDSLEQVKQKTKTIYVSKANRVIHWNNDSATKFWADYFGR